MADLATKKCEFGLAQECLKQAQDFGGLLLMATSAGNADMVQSLAENAAAGGQCLSYDVIRYQILLFRSLT